MLNFQYSKINQDEFEQLSDLLLKFLNVYATSKFDVGKIHSPLQFPLKRDSVFKSNSLHLQDKVNRLLDIHELYEIIEQQAKGKTFSHPEIFQRGVFKNSTQCTRCSTFTIQSHQGIKKTFFFSFAISRHFTSRATALHSSP